MSEFINLPKIHPVTHVDHKDYPRNRWCGPAAVSSLTGLPAEDIAEWIRCHRGRGGTTKGIQGTYPDEILAAIVAIGFRIVSRNSTIAHARSRREAKLRSKGWLYRSPDEVSTPPTLTQWLRVRDRKKTYLVVAGNHWCVIRGNKYCCAVTQKIVSVRDAAKRRGRVTHVYEVTKPKHARALQIGIPKAYKKVWDEKRNQWKLVA